MCFLCQTWFIPRKGDLFVCSGEPVCKWRPPLSFILPTVLLEKDESWKMGEWGGVELKVEALARAVALGPSRPGGSSTEARTPRRAGRSSLG